MKKGSIVLEREKELTETSLPQENNVIRLVHGGGQPPSDNWLKGFEIGTIFLSRRKSNSMEATRDFTFGEFCVYNKTEKAMLLAVVEGGAPRPVWVDPARFVNQMDLIEVLRTQSFEQVGEEDDGSGAIQPE